METIIVVIAMALCIVFVIALDKSNNEESQPQDEASV